MPFVLSSMASGMRSMIRRRTGRQSGKEGAREATGQWMIRGHGFFVFLHLSSIFN